MTKGGLATYGAVLPNIARKDIREFYSSCLASTTELYNETTSLLLSKGLEIRPPYIPYHTKVDFIEKQSFLAGWLGEQRPLTGTEIMHLFANIQTNSLGKAITLGFGQVSKSPKISKYMNRGNEISSKHIDIFAKHLSREDLPVPMTWDHEVENITTSPFSEKLMMFQIGLLSSAGVGNYGVAISLSKRRDVAADYIRLSGEVLQFAEDGININIENGWLERPPHAADRDEINKLK
ncbi:DUF3231 family protein [Litchfieldia alkalitelluris]|uniref:DUF3231 family protein n=1 Tax=Litchfieldia alkalitelluris TaxID=304268 RepID=UPI0022871AE4|nr:DUF3231 family protein [Litchfieldia alkalitelluris]